MVRIIDDGGDGSVVFGFDKQKISQPQDTRRRVRNHVERGMRNVCYPCTPTQTIQQLTTKGTCDSRLTTNGFSEFDCRNSPFWSPSIPDCPEWFNHQLPLRLAIYAKLVGLIEKPSLSFHEPNADILCSFIFQKPAFAKLDIGGTWRNNT